MTLQKTIIIMAILIIIILSLSFITFLLYIRPPKFSSPHNPSQFNLKYENISFKTFDGLTLKGWFIPSNQSNTTIIIGHGFPFDKNNIMPVTKFLNKHYNLLYYDFRYFGESQGKITTIAYKERSDVIAAINYLKTRKDINASKIGLYGFSMSAATFLQVNSRDVKAIVSDSSFSNLYDITKKVYFIFPGFIKYPFVWTTLFYAKLFLGIKISEISPEENVKSLNTPILLIHGEEDSQISVEHSKAIHKNALNSELWIVKGADHGQTLSINKNEYESKVLKFFDKHLL